MAAQREFDIVVFGATGFTGGLVARYLSQVARGVRWAIAGRNPDKLEHLRGELQSGEAPNAPADIIRAEIGDSRSMQRMTERTRVLVTTVGPYAQYGEPVVKACVDTGTDYVDITGEPDFVQRMVDTYDGAAREAGLRVVNCCGFDSIPHDLGVLHTVEQLPRGEPITVEGFVRARSTFSGGTWSSGIRAMARYRETRAAMGRRPRASGDRKVGGIRPRIRYERRLGAWACPLPTIDPLIVLRSARTLDRYGPEFRYGHYVEVQRLSALVGGVAGVGSLFVLSQLPPTREMLLRRVQPGEGPSEEKRARSRFAVTFLGHSRTQQVRTRVSGGDPGYDETAKMVSESALSLAFDRDRLPNRSGVLTPAVAMGDPLRERLERAGIRFEVVGSDTR